jgi:hypothetical protein
MITSSTLLNPRVTGAFLRTERIVYGGRDLAAFRFITCIELSTAGLEVKHKRDSSKRYKSAQYSRGLAETIHSLVHRYWGYRGNHDQNVIIGLITPFTCTISTGPK